ncbi:MAG TPA: hypothetical protein VHG91_12590 [Longimicrobium sp.]|nr:hypothetical protein [Longimicrobium sp.]
MAKKNGVGSADRLRVGDRVLVQYPLGPVLAEVIEDRGHLGVGGRRILRIRTLEAMEDIRQTLEVPEEELLLAREANPALYRPEKGGKARLHAGQRVIAPSYGATLAEIVEDRGSVGHGGRRIVRIRTLDGLEEEIRTFEVPAEDIIVLQ